MPAIFMRNALAAVAEPFSRLAALIASSRIGRYVRDIVSPFMREILAPPLPPEQAFLPAALEIMDTPPSPLGRRLVYGICATGIAALAWATFGKVDIVAVASGKVVSRTRTQVVQPFETASVERILVKSGRHVEAGEPLIELDRTAALAEQHHARNDLVAASLDALRLTAFLNGATSADFATITDATDLDIERAKSQLDTQFAAREGQIATLRQEKLQRQSERQALERTATKIEKTLPMIATRADIRAKAAETGLASIPAKLESEQLLIETKAELEINKSKIASLDASIEGLERKITATESEIRTTAMGDLQKARDRIRSAEEALAKSNRRVQLQTLRAPVAGTVQQMHVVSVGSVVTPAQQLLSIAPDDDAVEIEAVLDNQDVGFVAVGQQVEVKVDAFPFTRYGLLSGTVTAIDRDAEAAPVGQQAPQGSQRAADDTSHVELSERLRYTVHVTLANTELDVDGRTARLIPGMAIKAEILTGKRRIIDFILAPLREHLHNAMRER